MSDLIHTGPIVGLDEDLGQFLERTGLLAAGQLRDNWYVLHSEALTVLIDTTKPRVAALFTHGSLGPFQQVIYTPAYDLAPIGIYPQLRAFGIDGNPVTLSPILNPPNDPNPPARVNFDPQQCRLELFDVTCYNAAGGSGTIPRLVFAVDGQSLIVEMDSAKSTQGTSLHCDLYPLYDSIVSPDGTPFHLNYVHNAEVQATGATRLRDGLGRMPALEIDPGAQGVKISARHQSDRLNAHELTVEIDGLCRGNTVTLTFLPNPVICRINPYVEAGKPATVTISSPDMPRLLLGMSEIPVREAGPGAYTAEVSLYAGEHTLTAICGRDQCRRTVQAVGDPREWAARTADVLLTQQYHDGPLEGFFDFMFFTDDLLPIGAWDGGYNPVCLSYGHRVAYLLSATTMLTGQAKYLDALERFLQASKRVSHEFDDGSLMPPPDLGADGQPIRLMQMGNAFAPDAFTDIARPWNQMEFAACAMHAARAARSLGQPERAKTFLELAYNYAAVLFRMQFADGSFSDRYIFWNCKVSDPGKSSWRFPIPQGFQMTALPEMLEEYGMPEQAERVRQMFLGQIGYCDAQTSIVLAGAEAMPNSAAWLQADAMGHAVRRALGTATPENDRRFLDSARLGILLAPAPIDHPDQYFNPILTGAGLYYSYNKTAIAGKVSMSDFSALAVALEADRLYAQGWGSLVWRWVFSARQSSMLNPNGAISGCLIDVPGFRHLLPYTTSDCDLATWGLGLLALCDS